MCGIVAIISKTQGGFFQNDKTLWYQMLISNMFRGMDSTGSFAVNKYGNLNWIKDASPAPFFINKKEMANYMNKFISDYHIVVGHNRKATMGSISSENAHPFIEGNICLVHNGTLTSHKNLADTVVDSHAICHHINEHGYKSLFKKMDGAYALIWYNAAEKTLYFARNSERPLHIVETDTRIYLASEEKMLDWLLDRNNVSKYKIEIVPTDKIFKFNLETRKLECETKPKKASGTNQGQRWMSPAWNAGHNQNQQQSRQASTSSNQHSTSFSQQHSGNHQASIEDYASGEEVLIRPVDFDITSTSTKIVFETQDNLRATACKYFPHSIHSQMEIDQFLNAKSLKATIQHITYKRGNLTLWLSTVSKVDDVVVTARNGKPIKWDDIQEAGGCCFMCGTTFDDPKDVEFAEINTNSAGEIIYMTCESCSDQVDHLNGYRSSYAGHDC